MPQPPEVTPTELSLAGTEPFRPLLQGGRLLPGPYVITGPSQLPSWFLAALCPPLKLGARVFWLDAGNTFNAYGASYHARSWGWDPRTVLAQINLARPFNLFQLETMVRRKVPQHWQGEPVVISDPFPMLYDADVPTVEARRVFLSVLAGMMALPAVWLVLAVDRKAPPDRAGWLNELAKRAVRFASLQTDEPAWHLTTY